MAAKRGSHLPATACTNVVSRIICLREQTAEVNAVKESSNRQRSSDASRILDFIYSNKKYFIIKDACSMHRVVFIGFMLEIG